jgi:hypothetical protein
VEREEKKMKRLTKYIIFLMMVFCTSLAFYPISKTIAPSQATISGTVGLADHGNNPVKGVKVELWRSSQIMDYDYTDDDGDYTLYTDPFWFSMGVTIKFTYKVYGYYENDWCEPKTIAKTVRPGRTYDVDANLEDNSAVKTRQHYLTLWSAYWEWANAIFDFKPTFRIDYEWDWNSALGCYEPGIGEINFYSWTCDIASVLGGPFDFEFQVYPQGWPLDPNQAIYSYTGGVFYRTEGMWNTLSGTCSITRDSELWFADTISPGCWHTPTAVQITW